MKKSEIKQGIKSIIDAIKLARKDIDKRLQPYKDIKEHLDIIQNIAEESGIDTSIDYETILDDTLRSCITENADIQDIEEQFDMLLADLENWQDESSENKSQKIQEEYIDILSEIKESIEIDSIECEQDLDDRLFDMIGNLEEIEI